MLCAFILMIPNMDDAAKQGWNVFFWAMDARVPVIIKELLYIAILVSFAASRRSPRLRG